MGVQSYDAFVLNERWGTLWQVAETCLNKAKDLSGLLLLYTARGSAKGLELLAPDAEEAGRANIAFLSLFLLGRISECVDLLLASNRIPEVLLT
jgi:coatomer subunit beta'